MKFKATDFRAIAYGISAICIATAELHRTGLLDKAIDGGKQITNKLRKKSKKSTVKTLENPVIQQAAENVYYAECFRHGGYKN